MPPRRPGGDVNGRVPRRADGDGKGGGERRAGRGGPRPSSPVTRVDQRGRLRQGPRRPRGRPAWRRRLRPAAGPARDEVPRWRWCSRGTATTAPSARAALPHPPSYARILATYPPPTPPPLPATGAWHSARAVPIGGSRPRPRQHRRGGWCLMKRKGPAAPGAWRQRCAALPDHPALRRSPPPFPADICPTHPPPRPRGWCKRCAGMQRPRQARPQASRRVLLDKVGRSTVPYRHA